MAFLFPSWPFFRKVRPTQDLGWEPVAIGEVKLPQPAGSPSVPQGMGYSLGVRGAGADNLPPSQEVEGVRSGVGDRVGQTWRDVDQGAVDGDDPFPDLAGGGFPGEDGLAVEGIKPFPVAGVEMVPPALPRVDGNKVKGVNEALGFLDAAPARGKSSGPGCRP